MPSLGPSARRRRAAASLGPAHRHLVTPTVEGLRHLSSILATSKMKENGHIHAPHTPESYCKSSNDTSASSLKCRNSG